MSLRAVMRVLATNAPGAVIAIRAAVGCVFLSEGVQKFLFSDALGAGRFAKIGIPWPHVMGSFVGGVEIVAGILVLVGLATRVAALALTIDMLVAITSTKLPILLGHGFFGFASPAADKTGFWVMMHEARTDLAMILGAAFLLWVGAGAISIDAAIARRTKGA